MNVEDQKDQLIVTAEVPGFDKENLKVNISDDNVLTICGEQKKEHIEQSKDKKYVSPWETQRAGEWMNGEDEDRRGKREQWPAQLQLDRRLTLCCVLLCASVVSIVLRCQLRTERAFGSVQRSLRLPRHVDKAGVTARSVSDALRTRERTRERVGSCSDRCCQFWSRSVSHSNSTAAG